MSLFPVRARTVLLENEEGSGKLLLASDQEPGPKFTQQLKYPVSPTLQLTLSKFVLAKLTPHRSGVPEVSLE